MEENISPVTRKGIEVISPRQNSSSASFINELSELLMVKPPEEKLHS